MTRRTRKNSVIWLIGNSIDHLSNAKLPTRGEALKVLFDFHIVKKKSLNESVKETVAMILPIWERARIPTRTKIHVSEQLRHLHKNWQYLKKLISRKSVTEEEKRYHFKKSLDDLFDIAHQDALSMIQIEEDRQFLIAQREKGRRGSMTGIDKSLAMKEQRSADRSKRAAAYAERCARMTETVELVPESSSDRFVSPENKEDSQPSTSSDGPHHRRQRRGTVSVITPEVAAALDRTKTSSRNASYVLSAMGASNKLVESSEKLSLSHSAIHRARKYHRIALATEIRESFSANVPLTVHWDGKIMLDYTGNKRLTVNRLPIMVSGKDITKILGIPKLLSGTGPAIAEACLSQIRSWTLEDRIVAMCFDTTSCNTGRKSGACIGIEKMLGRNLLNLACRHHIYEIILGKVFSLYDVSDSPYIDIFQHFRDYWPEIDQSVYHTALTDVDATEFLDFIGQVGEGREGLINIAKQYLTQMHPRDDYKELLELIVIFLGGNLPNGINFRYPGACHRARWMSRAIYAIKMWLFREQIVIQRRQTSRRGFRQSSFQMVCNHLRRVSLFVTTTYFKYWFACPLSSEAPRNDLQFLISLKSYPDEGVAKVAFNGFSQHLWYLSEILVGFSLFDKEITCEEKRRMVYNMQNVQGSDESQKRHPPIHDPGTMQLHNFFNKSTVKLFNILGVKETFLSKDPLVWNVDESYMYANDIVSSLRVTNDLAERGVALMHTFNEGLVRTEEEKQFVLQVVEQHRQKFSKVAK